MWTREEPYATVKSTWDIRRGVKNGSLRPHLDQAWPPRLSVIMKWCWCAEPAGRPTAEQVYEALQQPEVLADGCALPVPTSVAHNPRSTWACMEDRLIWGTPDFSIEVVSLDQSLSVSVLCVVC